MFEIGTPVVVKNIPSGSSTEGLYFNPQMTQYIGETFYVTESYSDHTYRLNDTGSWYFHEEWLMPANESGKRNVAFRCGQKAILKDLSGMDPLYSKFINKEVTITSRRGYLYGILGRAPSIPNDALEPIEGYDYNSYSPVKYNEGDVVQVKIDPDSNVYGTLTVTHEMWGEYNNAIGVITFVKGNYDDEGCRYRISADSGEWVWNSLMLKPAEKPVLDPNETYYRNEDGFIKLYKSEEVLEQEWWEFKQWNPINIRLLRDVFGVGKTGDIMPAIITRNCDALIITKPPIKGILYESEYEEV